MRITKSITIGGKRKLAESSTENISPQVVKVGSGAGINRDVLSNMPLSNITNVSQINTAVNKGNDRYVSSQQPSSDKSCGQINSAVIDLTIDGRSNTTQTPIKRRRKVASTIPLTCFKSTNQEVGSTSGLKAIERRSKKRNEVATNRDVDTNSYFTNEYIDLGDCTNKCKHCNAIFWYEERINKRRKTIAPTYPGCCKKGKVQLPPMPELPAAFKDLLYGDNDKSKLFTSNIRSYNMMFSFTSMGGKIDYGINKGNSPPVFKLYGQNHHYIGNLVPKEGNPPTFAQLYIYDTQHEIQNRMMAVTKESSRSDLHEEIVNDLKKILDEHNVLVKSFRMVRDSMHQRDDKNVKLQLIGRRKTDGRCYDLPQKDDVALLIVGDMDAMIGERDIVVETRRGSFQRITELHPSYLGLQYPLIFLFGQDGFREEILHRDVELDTDDGGRNKLTMREFFAYRIHERESEPNNLFFSRRLFQQFLVDAYTMVEAGRLTYIRNNQKQLRCELYSGLTDALLKGDRDPASRGKRICLPSSFTGSARYMIQNYQDAMALCRFFGYPTLLVTFTCNPKWPEVVRFLTSRRGLQPEDIPDIMCRLFKAKLDVLMDDLQNNKLLGTVKAVIYTIEWQKRGLPHVHIVLWLENDGSHPTVEMIDKIISAEIPDESVNPHYYAAVRDLMSHGPCGKARSNSPCMVEGRCSKYFPKKFCEKTVIDEDGYPIYKRPDNGRTILVKGIHLDNRYIVPHNPELLMKYGAHINVEWCNKGTSIKYLCKYVSKGTDKVTVKFCESAKENAEQKPVDEIKNYLDCRYIIPCEAVWRLFGHEIHYRNPSVERLSFHLEGQQTVVYHDDDVIDEVVDRPTLRESMFTAWLEANDQYKDLAGQLTYADFPTKFVWNAKERKWKPRTRGFKIGRIFYVAPGQGELYYLRTLLNIVRGPTSYEDIRTVNGHVHPTFRDACYDLGLLDDDKEYIDGIVEASRWGSAISVRNLFVTLLLSGSIARPEHVWESCFKHLSEDILYTRKRILGDEGLQLTPEQIRNYTLLEIEKVLRNRGKSLKDFPTMPYPDESDTSLLRNRLILDEMNYDRDSLAVECKKLLASCTDEQKYAYDKIIKSVDDGNGGVFFLYGSGGTGKTFLWRLLSASLRSKGDIVLNVASSGIASLLLPNGRTGHSRFAIPLVLHEDTTCNIKQGSPLAELIVKTRLIIWDEAPMVHKHCFEALDRTLRDIMRFDNPNSFNQLFGGKTIVMGGDFRQILPVIPGGTREDIVMATINTSHLWSHCIVLKLTKNMRLKAVENDPLGLELKNFSEWILSIGDGTYGGDNDGAAKIKVPSDLLVQSSGDLIKDIVESTYPEFVNHFDDVEFLQGRAILAPTLEDVEKINEYMVSYNQSDCKTYLSADSICTSENGSNFFDQLHSTEFLNTIRASGLPNHHLSLKVGVPVMLLRNTDPSAGLCNGTRLIITRLGQHIVEAKILNGNNVGDKVFIPRMSLTPSDLRLPFNFQRRQFPLVVSYAMTINKSQGQSLTHVGLFLRRSVFSHGQLYVALSRVTNRAGLKILVCDEEEKVVDETTNVVYKEVFQNL